MAQIILSNGAAAATPAAGTISIYSKTSDKRLYYKDETGAEVGPLSTGGGVTSFNTRTGAVTLTEADVVSTLPLGFNKNALINSNFAINQRAVSGSVVLSAGAYGHDRFKAGASGCTYTFSTTNNVTTLTISAGSLMQVIEGNNLQSGTYTLSWSGTAQGRIDSGAYGVSGITGTAVGGTNQTCEWGTGTLSLVQYERGSIATPFENRQIGAETLLCYRYYETGLCGIAAYSANTFSLSFYPTFVVPKRTTPTITSNFSYLLATSGGVVDLITALGFRSYATTTATGQAAWTNSWAASAEL